MAPDVFTPEKRSKVMSAIRSRGNLSTEIKLISAMRNCGITGWRRGSRLPGRPDFLFPKARVAVFVDGDFWHGHPVTARIPASNRAFWVKKIESNKARDKKVNRLLKEKGWRVLRIWESSLKSHPVACLRRLRRALLTGALRFKSQAA